MSEISAKIKSVYSDYAVYKDKEANALFAGRTLPNYVKDYILNRYSVDGVRDDEAIREYLEAKMPRNRKEIKKRLMDGEAVNVTACVIIKLDLDKGRVTFTLPGIVETSSDMIISPQVLQDDDGDIVDGENWGNVTIQYVQPKGNAKGYIVMTSFKSFKPYKNLNFDNFIDLRTSLTTDEWIDVLIATLGYIPESFPSVDVKLAMLMRLIPYVEANLNFIELGPKSSGKSHVYSNLSKYTKMISGKCTRAQLIYNYSTKDAGPLQNHDVVVFDEVSSLSFESRGKDDIESFLKTYLENGRADLAKTTIESTCGMGLVGNIELTAEMVPVDDNFQRVLPDIFRSSAMMDRFHLFIPGWRLPKIMEGQLYNGWAIDAEFFSEYLHYLRTQTYGHTIFDELVTYDRRNSYIRHSNAVRRVASALCKLLFPHLRSVNELAPDDLSAFKALYGRYCLTPAIEGRTYIYNQCKTIDPEFTRTVMPEYSIDDSSDIVD